VSLVKEYYTIVRSGRRITVPSEFKEGEPVKIRIERVDASVQQEASNPSSKKERGDQGVNSQG